MNTEDRIKQLETALEAMEEKRKIMMFDLFAVRSVLIGLTPLIAASSAAQRGVAKSLAEDRMASYLLLAGLPGEQAAEALAALEDLFYEIDAARNAADQTPARPS